MSFVAWVKAGVVVVALAPPAVVEAAVVTRGPYLQMGTATTVTVRWRTDTPTDSRVRYGASPASLNAFVDLAPATTEHQVSLAGLVAGTRYFYSVGSTSTTLAGGADYFFLTAPGSGPDRPIRIWVVGDSGHANASAAAVRDAYLAFTGPTYTLIPPYRGKALTGQEDRRPSGSRTKRTGHVHVHGRNPAARTLPRDYGYTNLWLMLGDNAYNSGLDSEYQAAVFNQYARILRQSVLWPTIGNHDAGGPAPYPYFAMFTLPAAGEAGGVASGTERYYSFDYGGVHFVCLDSELSDRSPAGPMANWLRLDLAANLKRWTIAYWHHPPYSKGSHDSDAEAQLVEMRESFLPIIEDHGVDLVLTGHSHSYERSFLLDGHYGPSGTLTPGMIRDGGSGGGTTPYRKDDGSHQGAVYAVAGSASQTGGGPLDHPAMFISLDQLGSLVLDLDANRLDVRFLRETGGVGDAFTLLKPANETPIFADGFESGG
jgi:hypothetical protein